jgi:lipoprotein-anchoring transpeptidase ErfK/SrfK
MALASQSARNDRNGGTARQRGGVTLVIVSIAAIAAAAGAYMLFQATGDGSGVTGPRTASAAGGMLAESVLAENGSASRRDALHESATAGEPAAATVNPNPAVTPPAAAQADRAASDAGSTPTSASAQETSVQETLAQETLAQETPSTPPAAPEAPATPPPAFGNGLNGAAPQSPAAQPAATPAEAKLREGLSLAATEPVKARLLLSQAVLSNTLAEPEARQAADALSRLSAQLFLTPVYNANDPICTQYTIQPNDSLEKIVRKQKLGCDWRLVARLNKIKNPAAIQVGKRLKLPVGPFSAVVSKRDYRLYLCTGTGDDRVIVAALPVGLGEANGTPTGRFKVRASSKLINPEWTHPVTGQRYEADDPANPIGEHWLGIEGVEDANSALLGYGIHGTVDNDSIGHDRSLGCVRLLADDVALVWETLAEGSSVEIWRGAGG